MDKKAVFAGTFYPEVPEKLNKLLESYKEKVDNNYKSKAIIVPHAGYIYSGHAAMKAFQHLEFNENIFIIAPSHHQAFENIVLPKYSFFETPLGSVEVNNRLIKDLSEKFPCTIENEVFENEHSIEVQLPFLQNIFLHQKHNAAEIVRNLAKHNKKFKIVPILVGKCDYRLIADIIEEYWENSSFIISSDLSHFYTLEQCRQIDTYTATLIETGRNDLFQAEQACGLIGIRGLVEFANRFKWALVRAEMYNSGDISQDKDRVVGYGAWYLYEGSRNDFIESYYKEYIVDTVKKCLTSAVNNEVYIPSHIPQALAEYGASFVTLNKSGQLRGCIGSVYPTKPLILDIIDNTKNAAFTDPRFEPVLADEIADIEVSISILSSIERIKFKDEKDLLSKIYPYGIIIAEKAKRAVYLPVVWEQLPDREVFLNSLKEKAGLPSNYFSKTIEAYKFTALYIKENQD